MAGVINKIRERSALLIVIVGGAMALFIFGSDALTTLGGGGPQIPEVGKVRDAAFTKPAFDVQAQQFLKPFYLFQGEDPSDEIRETTRNQAWQTWVDSMVYAPALQELGLRLSDAEWQILFGKSNPQFLHPGIRQFMQQQLGQGASPQQMAQQINDWLEKSQQNINQGSQGLDTSSLIVTYLENMVLNQRYGELARLATRPATYISQGQLMDAWREQNTKVDLGYLAVPYVAVFDEEVTVDDDELETWYEANRTYFRQTTPGVNLRFVALPIRPTAADTKATFIKAREVAERLQGSASITEDTLLASPYMPEDLEAFRYQPLRNIPFQYRTDLANAPEDSIIGPKMVGGAFRVVKLSDRVQATGNQPFYAWRHILISPQAMQPQDGSQPDSAMLEQNAQQFVSQVDSFVRADTSQFRAVASQYSHDPRNKRTGGEIGWVPNLMNLATWADSSTARALQDSLQGQGAQLGRIIGPIRSQYGYHVFYLADTASELLLMTAAERIIEPSQDTKKALRRKMDRLAVDAQAYGLDSAATLANLPPPRNQDEVLLGQTNLPGVQKAQPVMAWAFNDERETGDLSSVVDAEDAYVVAQITAQLEPGYKPLDAVRDQVRAKVTNQKKAALIVERLGNTQDGASLDELQKRMGDVSGPRVNTAKDVVLQDAMLPAIGYEPKVKGLAFRLPQGQTSAPIVGESAVYVLRVDSRTEPQGEPDEQTLNQLRMQLQQRRQNLPNEVAGAARAAAEVRDYRIFFEY